MADTTHDEITEENTAPDATPANEEVGETDVNFTTAAGTTTEPASSGDGTDAPSTGSTTSPSPDASMPDATGDEGQGPLASGATEDSLAAPDASSSDTASGNAPSTDDDEADENAPEAHRAMKGAHEDGHGATHIGTDTPERLLSNPWNDDTGTSLFTKETHSDEPLKPGCFDENKNDAAPAEKLGQAIELLGDVAATLG